MPPLVTALRCSVPAILTIVVPRLPTYGCAIRARRFFQQFAGLVGSPTIRGVASLAELVGSVPKTDEIELEDAKRPIEVFDHTYNRQIPTDRMTLVLAPVPATLLRRAEDRGYATPTPEEIAAWLAEYPSLGVLGQPASVHQIVPLDLGAEDWILGVQVSFGGVRVESWSSSFRAVEPFLDVCYERQPGQSISGLVLPRVADNVTAMKPLVTWWAILYACSMLARYHPRTWVDLLDVDSSPYAVPTESVLLTASLEVPRLLAAELSAGY